MSVRMLRPMDVHVLNVACPKCKAKAGDLCITKNSRLLYSIGNYHAARRDAELRKRIAAPYRRDPR